MDKENQEQEKQVPKKSPSVQTEQQLDCNRAFAALLENQEIAYTMLEMMESDEDEEEEVGDDYYNEGSFTTRQQFVDLMFYEEGEDISTEDEMEEDEDDDDDFDLDELSYEELLALGEIIGHESRGLSTEEISSAASPYTHKAMQSRTSIDRCVICQVEYEEGEELVALRCEHPFHVGCINPWLQIQKICPICSMEVIKQKIDNTNNNNAV